MVVKKSNRMLSVATLLLLVAAVQASAFAEYTVTNLVSNQKGKAKHRDANLVNAWGIASFSGGPLWVSDAGTGLSTFYDSKGVKVGTVTIPGANQGQGSPTGMVANATQDFQVSQSGQSGHALFIFDTLDGTISGWNPSVNAASAVIAVKTSGAAYTGLAFGVNKKADFIYAANAASGMVEMYDGSFNLVSSFTDPNLPKGSAPYGIQNIKGQLFVTFVTGTGGVVDIFSTAGKLIKTFTKSKNLNEPWGLALAPKNFGKASNAILVGNLGNGRINAFDANSGKFIGALENTKGKAIVIDGLWGLAFGQGGGKNGQPDQLFFTAGPNDYVNGSFGVIQNK